MPNIQRISDQNDGGGAITTVSPNTTVFANNLLVSVDGSKGTGHGDSPHCEGCWSTSGGSPVVLTHGIPTNYKGNADTCGHTRVGGSSNVFVGTDVDTVNIVTSGFNDMEEEDEEVVVSYFKEKISTGTFSKSEAEFEKIVTYSKVDTTPPVSTPQTPSDCSGWNITPFPSGNSIDDLILSQGYTIKSVTRSPFVVFDYPLRSTTAGLSVQEIACNLKHLTINVIIPIKAHFPKMVVTCTYRTTSVGSAKSQHPRGQAVDMQFSGATKKDYYTIAQWIKNNISYDQLLLEYKTYGSTLPWIHVSYNKNGNRNMVLTMMNDKSVGSGLHQLG